MIPKEYSFSVALKLAGSYKDKLENCYTDDEWAYFPLDREILARNTSEEEMQKQFNEEAKKSWMESKAHCPSKSLKATVLALPFLAFSLILSIL